MAYALGYDLTDFESDEEDTGSSSSSNPQGRVAWQSLGNTGVQNRLGYAQLQQTPSPLEMDKLDTATLERLGWMEPLGYRALSEATNLPVDTLRKHFWASKLKETSPEFHDVEYYFRNSHSQSHGVQMRLKRVINLKRYNENNCDYKDANVQLLWHGTAAANVAGILTNGFMLPMRNGMFGRGVYFADRVSKSYQYCRGSGMLFLCAVNLGKMYQATSSLGNLTAARAAPPGYDSVMGCGTNVPDPNDVKYYRGAKMPCGKTQRGGLGGGLLHNEFIVYDLAKIAILFFVQFDG